MLFVQVSFLISVLICASKGIERENEISSGFESVTFSNSSQVGLEGPEKESSLKKATPSHNYHEKELFSKSNSPKKSRLKKKTKLIEKWNQLNLLAHGSNAPKPTSNSTNFDTAKQNDSLREDPKVENGLQNGVHYLDNSSLTEEEILDQLKELYTLQNPDEEFKDEEKDAELFKAIYTSVFEYKKTWAKRFFHKLLRRRTKRDEELVCFSKELGCFRDEGPFDYFDMLPNTPEEVNTQFILYTKENPTRGQYIKYENVTSITSSNFKGSRKSKFIIHGFGSSCTRVWVREMRDTLLKVENVNIICVSWTAGASGPNYVRAASNTRLIGRQVALLLEKMVKYANTNLKDVHLVGFSLGAHVSGFVGQRLEELRLEEQRSLNKQQRIDAPNLQGQKLGRITGLDPAGPFFESFPERMRLDKSDAEFVDVIHTNADSLLWGGLGAYDPLGDVDFYPNGGRVQKGCANLFVGGVTDILWPKEGDGRYLCNHRRGYKYFMESLLPVCKFPAFACRDYESFLEGDCFPCTTCGNMGYYSDKAPGRGKLYLITRDTEPFCANQYKVEIWHSGGPPTTESVSTKGYFYVTFVNHDGKNETIEVTRDRGKKMEAGSRTISIVVPHVALSNIVNLQVQYKTHRGWISSGYNKWAIDKVSIMDSFGKIQSFCHRGLTMESGLTMLFPLVPGDCNPRELTLHPLPIPWPGIDYDKLNGFEHDIVTQATPPAITNQKTTAIPFSNVEKTSTPKANTIDIITPLPPFQGTHFNHHNNSTDEFPKKETVNQTAEDHDHLIHSMTEEEYVAWKDAPPPNLDPSQYPSTQDETSPENRRVSVVINKMNPVNIIPAPQLGRGNQEQGSQETSKLTHYLKTNAVEVRNITGELENAFITTLQTPNVPPKLVTVTVDPHNQRNTQNLEQWTFGGPRIREDAQAPVTKLQNFPLINEDYLFRDPHGVIHSSVGFDSFTSSYDEFSHKEVNDTLDFYAKIYTGKEKGIVQEPTNSIIEGEVPYKERARAIKFDSNQHLQVVNTEFSKHTPEKFEEFPIKVETTDIRDEFDSKTDPSKLYPTIDRLPPRVINQPSEGFGPFQDEGLRFHSHEGIPNPTNFEPHSYSFPSTVLKPPKIVRVPFIPPTQQPEKKGESFISRIISRFTNSDKKAKRDSSKPPNSYPNIRYENRFGGHEEPLTHSAYISPIRNAPNSPHMRPVFRDQDNIPIPFAQPPFYYPYQPLLPPFPSFPPTHPPTNFPSSRRGPKLFIRAERRPDGPNPPYYVQFLPPEIGSFSHRRYNSRRDDQRAPNLSENRGIPPNQNSRMDRGRSLGPEGFTPNGEIPPTKIQQDFPSFLMPFNNKPNAKYIPLRFSRKRKPRGK